MWWEEFYDGELGKKDSEVCCTMCGSKSWRSDSDFSSILLEYKFFSLSLPKVVTKSHTRDLSVTAAIVSLLRQLFEVEYIKGNQRRSLFFFLSIFLPSLPLFLLSLSLLLSLLNEWGGKGNSRYFGLYFLFLRWESKVRTEWSKRRYCIF